MVIDIIGAGAIGLLFGSKLMHNGNQVRFWCRTEEQTKQINEFGIMLEEQVASNSSKEGSVIKADAFTFSDDGLKKAASARFQPQFAIIALKQADLDHSFIDLLQKYANFYKKAAFIVLQNGIGHVEKLQSAVPDHPLIQAVTSEGAFRKANTHVLHTGRGVTYLSYSSINKALNVNLLEKALKEAGFSVEMSKNIKSYVYFKLLINAVINPLTALFHVKNGELPNDDRRLQVMKQLFEETRFILMQYEPSVQNISFTQVLEVCEKTYSNYSSMFVDVKAGRKTEIEAINGAVMRMAKEKNLNAPLNEALFYLIEARHP